MRRWVCPTCGNGIHGPERPRTDDVRRYCLPCSAKTGRLVDRTCPALNRKRESRQAAQKEQATARKAKQKAQRDARWVYQGVDLEKEAKALWKLYVAHNNERRSKSFVATGTNPALPRIDLLTRNAHGACGRAWSRWRSPEGKVYPNGRITVSIGHNVPLYEALLVLSHELAHVAAGTPGHGRRWAGIYAEVTIQRYGLRDLGVQNGPRPEVGYAVDRWLEPKMAEWQRRRVVVAG